MDHVVQESHGLPEVRIAVACRREMPERVGHGVAMPAQTLRFNPLVQDGAGTISER